MYQDEIQPASMAQIIKGRNGRMILVEDDVGSVVKQIHEINTNFRVRHSDAGQYFVVFHRDPISGKEKLVTTAQELDHRLLKRVKKISSAQYSYVDEVEELDKKAKKNQEYLFGQQVGEIGERLAHAMRKDRGVKKNF